MEPDTRKLKFFYIPVLAGLIIASTHFILSNFYTLSKWEGGGFGMYSEPNPHNSRVVRIAFSNSNGSFDVRLYPPDKRFSLYINSLEDEEKKKWDQLINKIKVIRVFPRALVTNRFLSEISNELLEINSGLKTRMRSGNSEINITFYVNELGIDRERRVFKSKKLFSKTIEI